MLKQLQTMKRSISYDSVDSTAPPRFRARKAGVLFGGLKFVPHVDGLDPPPRKCFNCHVGEHNWKDCKEKLYEGGFCYNCGRYDVKVTECPRCAEAYRIWSLQKDARTTQETPRRFENEPQPWQVDKSLFNLDPYRPPRRPLQPVPMERQIKWSEVTDFASFQAFLASNQTTSSPVPDDGNDEMSDISQLYDDTEPAEKSSKTNESQSEMDIHENTEVDQQEQEVLVESEPKMKDASTQTCLDEARIEMEILLTRLDRTCDNLHILRDNGDIGVEEATALIRALTLKVKALSE